MAEPESWEDADTRNPAPPPNRPQFALNANASTFAFNPAASTFNPYAPNPYAPYGAQTPYGYVPQGGGYMPPGSYYNPNLHQRGGYAPQAAPYGQQGGGYGQQGNYYNQAGNARAEPKQPSPNTFYQQQQQQQQQQPQSQPTNVEGNSQATNSVYRNLGAQDQAPKKVNLVPTERKEPVKIVINAPKPPVEEPTAKVSAPVPTPAPAPAPEVKQPAAPKVEETTEKLSTLDIKKETPVEEIDSKAVVIEEEEEEDFPEEENQDNRDHLNLVFIGHVDAGKSTIGGQILFLSNMVDERTIQKYEREAKEKNRDSWYMAYIMDTNEEERAKGKTVEVGRASFETLKRRYTILDAPGHKNYVPNMISGASQADVGVLVISARKGEFETGFERGGQTREHAQLAKTLGVSKLVCVVNKMDDHSVNWSKDRFDEIVTKTTPFFRQCGYNVKKDVQFLPISGLNGANMKTKVSNSVCPWWTGPSFFDALDVLEPPERDPKGPFRMPLIDKYRDMGTVVMGKVESGRVKRGMSLLVMPNKVRVKVVTIFRENDEVPLAKPGENLRIRLTGIEEDDISAGFVLSSIKNPIRSVLEFNAQLQVLELLDHKAIFTAGYKAVLHIHSVVEECEIIELLQQIDPKTKKPMKKKPLFVKSNAVVTCRIQVGQLICVENFSDYPQLGRFTLRDEGKTVAIGKVIKLITSE